MRHIGAGPPLLDEILEARQLATLDRDGQVDFAYDLPDVGRFRGSVCRQAGGLSAVFRVVPNDTPNLDDLPVPMQRDLFTKPSKRQRPRIWTSF